MYPNDYIMRQISLMVQFVSKLLFGRAEPIYERQNEQNPSPADRLHAELMKLTDARRYGEAENLLFEMLDTEIVNVTEVALDFYYRLSRLPDADLLEGNFTRAEIDQGLKDLLTQQGIALPHFAE